jgi:hypothetical protein
MKILFLFFIVVGSIIHCYHHANASEITGRISTDPHAIISTGTPPVEEPYLSVKPVATPGSSAMFLKNRNIFTSVSTSTNDKVTPKVLGIVHIADGSLLRGSRHRVYLVRGEAKRIVRNLAELRRYAGRPILDVSDAELSQYPDRAYLDGELLRARGEARIYVLEAGRKRGITSIKELAGKYPGQEIINVSPEELTKY